MKLTPFSAAVFLLATIANAVAIFIGSFLAFAALVVFFLCITGG